MTSGDMPNDTASETTQQMELHFSAEDDQEDTTEETLELKETQEQQATTPFSQVMTWLGYRWVRMLLASAALLALLQIAQFALGDLLPGNTAWWWLGLSLAWPLVHLALPPPSKETLPVVEIDEEGRVFLCVTTVTHKKESLFKKRVPTYVKSEYELMSSELVDVGLAEKVSVALLTSESKVHCLTRLHWWSRGPQQIMIGLLALIAVVTWMLIQWKTSISAGSLVVNSTTALWLTGCAIAYWVVWMMWAYLYLIITDKRVMLVYNPPFGLAGNIQKVFLSDLRGSHAKDQSWWHNQIGCGMVKGETAAAEIDAWIRKGIKNVKKHQKVSGLLDELRPDATAVAMASNE